MLKQSSAVTLPLMGHTISLGEVAIRAGDHKVIGTVRATATKRNDVIDMVGIANLFTAVVAFSLLTAILIAHVFNMVFTRRISEHRLSVSVISANNISVFSPPLAILFSHSTLVFFIPSALGFSEFNTLSFTLLPHFFGVGIAIAFFTSAHEISILQAITMLILITAFFTGRHKSARKMSVAVEVFRGCRKFLTALRTAFYRGIHSASLSLSHMLLSADGVSRRFSGVHSLADSHYFNANGAVLQELHPQRRKP